MGPRGGWALLAVCAASLVACGHERRQVNAASGVPAREIEGGKLLVLAPRVCVEVQVDHVHRLRAGETGLGRTRATSSALRRALAQGEGDATTANTSDPGCGDASEVADPRARIAEAAGSPAIVAELRRSGGTRALVTEVSTRLVCQPSWRRTRDTERWCHEDVVSVAVMLLDDEGRVRHVAGTTVDDEGAAASVVRDVLGATWTGAPGSVGIPGSCRIARNELVDCTGS